MGHCRLHREGSTGPLEGGKTRWQHGERLGPLLTVSRRLRGSIQYESLEDLQASVECTGKARVDIWRAIELDGGMDGDWGHCCLCQRSWTRHPEGEKLLWQPGGSSNRPLLTTSRRLDWTLGGKSNHGSLEWPLATVNDVHQA